MIYVLYPSQKGVYQKYANARSEIEELNCVGMCPGCLPQNMGCNKKEMH